MNPDEVLLNIFKARDKDTPKPQANKTIDEILPCISCGSQADPADGFGTCTCGNEQRRQAITQAMLDVVGEDEPASSAIYKSRIYSGTDQEHAEVVRLNEVAKGRNELRAEIRTAIKKIGEK